METVTTFVRNTADTVKSYVQTSPQTQEEIDKIQAERKKYYDDIKTFQTKVTKDLTDNKISPETGIELSALIKSSQEWLTNNPNATYLEVNNKHVNFPKLYEAIYERELHKNQLLSYIYFVQYLCDIFAGLLNDEKQTAGMTSEMKNDFTGLINSVTTVINTQLIWYQNNPKKDGIIYTQEIDNLTTKLINIAIPLDAKYNPMFQVPQDKNLSSFIKEEGRKRKEDKNPTPWLMKEQVAKNKALIQASAEQEYSNNKLIKESTSIAFSVFGSFILIAIILYGASLAANIAIGRDIHYRIFYFIFSCNPIVTPIIFAYTALMVLKGHPIPYYGILPISTEPATTRLGKILWFPFFYKGDEFEVKSKADFVSHLAAVGTAVLSMPKPDAIQL